MITKVQDLVGIPASPLEHLVHVSLVVDVAFLQCAQFLPRLRVRLEIEASERLRRAREEVGFACVANYQVEVLLPFRAAQRSHAEVDEPVGRVGDEEHALAVLLQS